MYQVCNERIRGVFVGYVPVLYRPLVVDSNRSHGRRCCTRNNVIFYENSSTARVVSALGPSSVPQLSTLHCYLRGSGIYCSSILELRNYVIMVLICTRYQVSWHRGTRHCRHSVNQSIVLVACSSGSDGKPSIFLVIHNAGTALNPFEPNPYVSRYRTGITSGTAAPCTRCRFVVRGAESLPHLYSFASRHV